MPVVDWKRHDSIAVIRMKSEENFHNPAFTRDMLQVLEHIVIDENVTGTVITSLDEKNWSLGIDVKWFSERYSEQDFQSIKECLYAINEVFKKILTLPVPVIAAINGHVAGNGLVLACACDFRFMRADKGLARFPEVDLGIPFLPGMIKVTKKAMPFYKFVELKYTGKKITASELEAHHIIFKACADKDALIYEAMNFAMSLNKKKSTLSEMKRRMNRGIIAVIDNEDPEYIESLSFLGRD